MIGPASGLKSKRYRAFFFTSTQQFRVRPELKLSFNCRTEGTRNYFSKTKLKNTRYVRNVPISTFHGGHLTRRLPTRSEESAPICSAPGSGEASRRSAALPSGLV